jgi:YHS domain-containing protein
MSGTKVPRSPEEETTMKTIARMILALMLLSAPSFAADLVNVAGASHIAMEGYDPVAFFTDSKPVKGSPSISATHLGAVYFFASEDHKRLFTVSPDKYLPQYGGFCAFAASRDALAPVDISTWQIRNGKLYLNFDHDILKMFNADIDGNVAKADANWPGLVRKNGQ